MAHFKRGKCRRNCPRAIRGSTTSWRARHGFRPARVPSTPSRFDYEDRSEWSFAWDWHRRVMWDEQPKPYLSMMSGSPAWWDRLFHTRRKRAEVRRLESKVLRGDVDPDDLCWPLGNRKPTIYYW